MPESKALVLASPGLTTNLLVERLKRNFDQVTVVLEIPESSRRKFSKRSKKIGFFRALSQTLFILGIRSILKKRKRIGELTVQNGCADVAEATPDHIVANLNDAALAWKSPQFQVDVVVVNGTRILNPIFLSNFIVPIVNIHVGITPEFRGVHGGYWALYTGQPEKFGVTLHVVDTGVDTGAVIDQKVLTITNRDNFATYPILQFLGGLELLEKHLPMIKSGKLQTKNPLTTSSKIWYHPGTIQYLRKRISKGIK